MSFSKCGVVIGVPGRQPRFLNLSIIMCSDKRTRHRTTFSQTTLVFESGMLYSLSVLRSDMSQICLGSLFWKCRSSS
jgi:hypothetical protein